MSTKKCDLCGYKVSSVTVLNIHITKKKKDVSKSTPEKMRVQASDDPLWMFIESEDKRKETENNVIYVVRRKAPLNQ